MTTSPLPCPGFRLSIVFAVCLTGCAGGDNGSGDAFGSSGGGTTTGTTTGTSTGGGPECVNVLGDPGFEAGNPNPEWTATSQVFSSPLCDASCSTEAAAVPRSGAWWVWFGGSATADMPSVSQSVVFGSGVSELRFFLAVWPGDASGDDRLDVTIDAVPIYTIVDNSPDASTDYTEVVLDVSAYANGQAHEIAFAGQTSGVGNSGFFIDDVSVLDCSGVADTTTGSTTQGTGTSTEGSGDTTASTESSGAETQGSGESTQGSTDGSTSATEAETSSETAGSSSTSETTAETSSSSAAAEESSSGESSSTGAPAESSSGAAE